MRKPHPPPEAQQPGEIDRYTFQAEKFCSSIIHFDYSSPDHAQEEENIQSQAWAKPYHCNFEQEFSYLAG